jgi:hypothetical protein
MPLAVSPFRTCTEWSIGLNVRFRPHSTGVSSEIRS